MKLGVYWNEFIPIERINILKDLLGIDIYYEDNEIHLPDYDFSSGEMVAIQFLRDPITPINFSVLDKKFGKILLQVHTEFWNFYFNR